MNWKKTRNKRGMYASGSGAGGLTLGSHQSLYLLGDTLAPVYFLKYQQLVEAFAGQGEFLSSTRAPEWTACYDRDSQGLLTRMPLLVFRPHNAAVIAPFVKACLREKIPLKIRCGGTSLTGASVACPEGIILLTGHLKKILSYDQKTGHVVVEPGVTPRQLNLSVQEAGWSFPLEMATGGVAGLAGCLSCHARGYHQCDRSFFYLIHKVTLIDGQGEEMSVPSSLVCGAEGLWGVITQIELKLMHRPSKRLHLVCDTSWEDLVAKLSALRQHQALTALVWQEGRFWITIEGDGWRIKGSSEALMRLFENKIDFISQCPIPPHSKHPSFVFLSSALPSHRLSDGVEYMEKLAWECQVECRIWCDVLGGALHVLLSSADESYFFLKKTETLFTLWVDWLDRIQGFLISSHGIGKLLRPYLPPFWKEEYVRFLKRLQAVFDPFDLFGRDHIFPPSGKSLEKVLHGQVE